MVIIIFVVVLMMIFFANLPSLISGTLFVESAPDRLRFIIISKPIIAVIIIILITKGIIMIMMRT